MVDKHSYITTLIHDIFDHYHSISYPGTDCSPDHLGTVEPTPVPGGEGRKLHKHHVAPCGPI
eukprot:1303403-Karenia_brevis.AAC.1